MYEEYLYAQLNIWEITLMALKKVYALITF